MRRVFMIAVCFMVSLGGLVGFLQVLEARDRDAYKPPVLAPDEVEPWSRFFVECGPGWRCAQQADEMALKLRRRRP